ncbi:MAG: ABC transporter permease [Chloroflexi bacterium]|nr:MAG: ABC transporter permease [Chloroflexota bacterium]
MRRIEFIIKRLGLAIFVLLAVSIMTFLIARVVPSNPAAAWAGPRPTQEQIDKATIELGLDKPLTVQYQRYMSSLLRGDLGTSVTTRQPILSDIKVFLPATLELVLVSILMAVVIGVPLGVLSGANKGKLLDHSTRFFSIAGVSMPAFWLGLILQLMFFSWLGLLPLGGRISTEVSLNNPITTITGFNLIDSLLSGNWAALGDSLRHIILPAFVLATYPIGLTIRMLRSSMIEVLSEKYILAAEISGIPRRTILFKLALKNAITPALNALGLSFVFSLTGAILVEIIFSWPGLGTYVTNAVLSVDFPVIVSVTLIVTVFYVLINLIIDITQAVLDPRVVLQ